MGYPTFRSWEYVVPEVVQARLRDARPDVVVADFKDNNAIAEGALDHRVPTMLRVVSAGCVNRKVPIPDSPLLLPYANSAFVACRLREQYGIEAPVVYPLVRYDRYRTERVNPTFVTFVNPVRDKGLERAVEIAAHLPHRSFLFLEGSRLSRADRTELGARLRRLPNVRFERSTRDMRGVYARTLLLIIPSEVEETFGRVALEAQVNGIPVVARHIGGLPEAVGAGGLLIPRSASAEQWAASIDAILSDESLSAQLSRAAAANAARPDFSAECNATRFLELATRLAARG